MPNAEFEPQFITSSDGTKEAVIIPIEEYQALQEDLEDLAVVAERRDESTISHETLLNDLKSNGKLSD